MSLTVDYSTVSPWLITIPKSDLSLITGTQYQLTVDEFWILLRDFTDNENPMAQPKLYSRIPATSSTPSITTVEEDYYELEFEDGLYSVNIVNGNTNIREVEVKNQVSVNTNNTTGYSTVAIGSGVTAQDILDIAAEVLTAAQTDPIHSNVKEVNDTTVTGDGTESNPWGPA